MSQEDSLATPDGDSEQPEVAALLAAVAHAPRPSALPIAFAALPEAVLQDLDVAITTPPTPRCGEVVDGRYRIDDKLGAGGMGVVFGATQLATGRKVALKWMSLPGAYRTQTERDQAFQRFVREAQATGRIRHPNVVDVYDAGKDPSAPYLVMERLEGETLRARIERGALGWDEALGLLLPALSGVSEAHRMGVVHRDLKPDNVFLAREGEGFVPKVLDFGVSRLRPHDELASDVPSLTRTGTVLGTPAYMPLEQLRAVGIDARTDVYALGVMLYEMLAGKRPYEARNAADFAALLTSERPTPLGRHRPDLRGPREAAVMKALARSPDERHADVEQFANALRSAGSLGSRLSLRVVLLGAACLILLGLAYVVRTEPPLAPPQADTPPAATFVPSSSVAQRVTTTTTVKPTLQAAPAMQVEPKRTSGTALRSRPVAVTTAALPAATRPIPTRRSPASLEQTDFTLAPTPDTSPAPAHKTAPSLRLGRQEF